MLQGKFLSQTVVSLGVLLGCMKGLTAAHQCLKGFHNSWFRRSYVSLLCFCLCFTRTGSISEVIPFTSTQFSHLCSSTYMGQEEESLALCPPQI